MLCRSRDDTKRVRLERARHGESNGGRLSVLGRVVREMYVECLGADRVSGGDHRESGLGGGEVWGVLGVCG